MNASVIGQRIGDRINPIVVKEMRQLVRGRMTVVLLVGVLGIGVLVLGLMAAAGSTNDMGRAAGPAVLGWIYLVLAVAMWLVVPVGAAMRLVREYDPRDPDLYFHTTLSPWSIFFGKWLSTMWLGLWLLLAAMPFAWIAWFLRGLGVMSIVAVMANLWMMMGLATGFALLVASLPIRTAGRRALLILGALVVGLGFAGMVLGGMAFSTVRGGPFGAAFDWTTTAIYMTGMLSVFGIGQLGISAGSWGASVGGLTVGLMVLGWVLDIVFLLVLGRALLSPPQANKTVLPRLVLVIGIGLGGLVALLLGSWNEMVVVWTVRTVGLVGSWIAVEVSQPVRLPRRARRWLSDRSGPLKVPRLLLSQSRGMGLVFCGLLMGAIVVGLVVTEVDRLSMGFHSTSGSIIMGVVGYGTMMFIYGLAACFIRDRIFSRWLHTSSTGLLMMGLIIVGTVMPLFSLGQIEGLFYLNPWVVFAWGMEGDMDDFKLGVLIFLTAIAFVANIMSLTVGFNTRIEPRSPGPQPDVSTTVPSPERSPVVDTPQHPDQPY